MVDHVTRSKVSLHKHNGSIESIMIETRKHNSMIFRAWEHSIIAQFLSIMCQGLHSSEPTVYHGHLISALLGS